MIELQCKCCREWMPPECFQRDVTMKTGRRNTCRICKSEQKRAWRVANAKPRPAVSEPVRRLIACPECNVAADAWRGPVNDGPLVATMGRAA